MNTTLTIPKMSTHHTMKEIPGMTMKEIPGMNHCRWPLHQWAFAQLGEPSYEGDDRDVEQRAANVAILLEGKEVDKEVRWGVETHVLGMYLYKRFYRALEGWKRMLGWGGCIVTETARLLENYTSAFGNNRLDDVMNIVPKKISFTQIAEDILFPEVQLLNRVFHESIRGLCETVLGKKLVMKILTEDDRALKARYQKHHYEIEKSILQVRFKIPNSEAAAKYFVSIGFSGIIRNLIVAETARSAIGELKLTKELAKSMEDGAVNLNLILREYDWHLFKEETGAFSNLKREISEATTKLPKRKKQKTEVKLDWHLSQEEGGAFPDPKREARKKMTIEGVPVNSVYYRCPQCSTAKLVPDIFRQNVPIAAPDDRGAYPVDQLLEAPRIPKFRQCNIFKGMRAHIIKCVKRDGMTFEEVENELPPFFKQVKQKYYNTKKKDGKRNWLVYKNAKQSGLTAEQRFQHKKRIKEQAEKRKLRELMIKYPSMVGLHEAEKNMSDISDD